MRMILAVLALTGAVSLPASAETAHQPAAKDAKAKVDPAKGQQIATTVCAACHNADGNSIIPQNPSLAGQHAAYVAKQLSNFKATTGKDGKPVPAVRNNAVMAGMAATLSPEDMKNIGAYYATQKPHIIGAKDKVLAEAGEKIYRGGVAATKVPACAACHGPNGAGIPSQYPRLGGQHADYTLAQLKAFRSGERAGDDANRIMQAIAAKLNDTQMKQLAEYIAGLK